MEKLFLGTFLTGKKLNIVDQQRIDRAVIAFELVDCVVLQRLDHVRHKALGVQIHYLRGGPVGDDGVTHGVHQVGLAQTHTPVDEQRVVGGAGILCDLHRGGARQLVGFALDKTVKGKTGIQIAARQAAFFLASVG